MWWHCDSPDDKMANSLLKYHISFQYICRKHLGIYPKSEVVIIKQNTFHFCFFLDWALGGAALGLTVALVEFIANSVVEVPTNDYPDYHEYTGCPKKNALSECCWSHSALAQSPFTGTP